MLVPVFGWGTICVFGKASAKGCQIIKTNTERNLRNGKLRIISQQKLRGLYALMAQIIMVGGVGVLLKQP